MATAGHVVGVVLGALVVASAIVSAVKGTVLPRSSPTRVGRAARAFSQWLLGLRSRRSADFERRDRAMAMVGPAALLLMLASWVALVAVGYIIIYLGAGGTSLAGAVELSGASIFTLGTTAARHLGTSLASYSEAGLGLLVLTLLIAYLPSIYAAFSRRENGVALLAVRAGEPPSAAAMLIRFHRIGETEARLAALWSQWESWFADVEETHTTFPILAFFRSPQPGRSWLTAAGVVLDAASLWVAALDHPSDPDAQLCIRAGYIALRRIADALGLPYPPEPRPGDPVTVGRHEWEAVLDELALAGLPVLRDRDEAWESWRGWRVNYDAALLNLAREIEAPPAPWVSDRSPVMSRRASRRARRRSLRRR